MHTFVPLSKSVNRDNSGLNISAYTPLRLLNRKHTGVNKIAIVTTTREVECLHVGIIMRAQVDTQTTKASWGRQQDVDLSLFPGQHDDFTWNRVVPQSVPRST